jgi:hypothetical protein
MGAKRRSWIGIFLPEGLTAKTSDVWIYISSTPVGPKEEDKDTASYIQSDIDGF